MQQPAGLAPLVRSPRTWPHIDGTLEHTSSSCRHRIFRTLMHRLCIDPNRYRTPGERTQSSPQARLRRSGTVQDIRYKAGCSPSSWPDLRSGIQRGIERTSASTANTPQYIARPFDLKSSSDPPLFIELFVFLSAGQQLATRPGDARETAMVQSEFSLGRSL